MSTLRRLWLPVSAAAFAAALLAVLFIGPMGTRGEAQAAVEPRATTRTITIPAGAFSPSDASWDYANYGNVLVTNYGTAYFVAPLFFEAPKVTIKRITLYAYDNGGNNVCVHLYRTTPTNGSQQEMGQVCSSGASTTTSTAFTQTSLTYRLISGGYGPYLVLYLPGTITDGYRFYGVKITYTQ